MPDTYLTETQTDRPPVKMAAAAPTKEKPVVQFEKHGEPVARGGARKGSLVGDKKRRTSIVSASSSQEAPAWRRRSSVVSHGGARRLSRIGSTWGLSLGKINQSQQSNNRPPIKYENTFKMKPDSGTQFDVSRVKKTMKALMELMLADTRYNPTSAKVASNQLCEKIKQTVKDLGYVRHKLVCNVLIGEVKDHGVQIASRCVWDPTTDNFATETFKNTSLFAVASVYGVYYE
ncbi:dynein light chain Tctex-type protein 2B-like [Ptychodera flava]|uniref:dynein light chain Tctex-type protein 2B-like n=1 Tax=Ptychodera flava TaxID=63121 RepID=UPI003969FDFA